MPELCLNYDMHELVTNFGSTACLFAKVAIPSARIYSFEPDQESYNTLIEEIGLRHLSRIVEPFPVAVGSTVGSVEFWHNKEHSADHRVVTAKFKESGVPSENVECVAAITVDEFVRVHGLQRIAFVKIDVQGYELAVCEGMGQTREQFPRATV